MNPSIATARVSALAEWAQDVRRNTTREGEEEIAFLLERCAIQIAKVYDLPVPESVTAAPIRPEQPVDQARADEAQVDQRFGEPDDAVAQPPGTE